ncbi:hypothetical protein BD626DRAFT_412078 [Schizophyllum amplum]|uniref:Myb/SANT-like domain-containing protein n=1 Tax=Schizophyllum amplum TaxID=97359 RepID=A0A550BY71_9AGAR|nr:hypothetical protein BD626DRAFT_412078 [Auriculariopsis ampla]
MANKSKIKKDKRKAERAGDPGEKNAHWTQKEEQEALQYYVDHKSEAGANGNFQGVVHRGAAQAIAHLRVRGAVKEEKHMRGKYREWRVNRTVVHAMKQKSGWTYTEEGGAGITAENTMAEGKWKEWINTLDATHKTAANKFKTKGWPLYHLMDQLYVERAKGNRAYYANLKKHAKGTVSSSSSDSSGGSDDSDSDSSGSEVEVVNPQVSQELPADQPHPSSQLPDTVSPSRPSTPPPTAQTGHPSAPATPSSARVGDKRAPTSPTVQKRTGKKRSKTDLNTTTPASHRNSQEVSFGSTSSGKFTGPAALMAISRSLDNHGLNVKAGLEGRSRGVDATPKRLRDAVTRAQLLEHDWLSTDEMLNLLDVFENIRSADAYLALDEANVELRKAWVRKRLQMQPPPPVQEEDVFM